MPSPADLPAPTLISVADIRTRFDFTPKRTYELIAAGAIKSALVGRRRFIVLASVIDYIASLAQKPTYGRTPNQHVARRSAEVVPLPSADAPDLSEPFTLIEPPPRRVIQVQMNGRPMTRALAEQIRRQIGSIPR